MDIVLKNVKKKDLAVIKSLAKALGFEVGKSDEAVKKTETRGFDAKAFSGSVEFNGNPVALQRELRDEWK